MQHASKQCAAPRPSSLKPLLRDCCSCVESGSTAGLCKSAEQVGVLTCTAWLSAARAARASRRYMTPTVTKQPPKTTQNQHRHAVTGVRALCSGGPMWRYTCCTLLPCTRMQHLGRCQIHTPLTCRPACPPTRRPPQPYVLRGSPPNRAQRPGRNPAHGPT